MDSPSRRCRALHEEFERLWHEKRLAEAAPVAEAERREAISAFGPEHPAVVRALLDAAMAAQAQGDLAGSRLKVEQAQALLEAIAALQAAQPNPSLAGDWHLYEAERRWAVDGDNPGAEQAFEQALASFRASGRTADAMDTLVRLGQFHEAAGRRDRAAANFQQALDMGRAHGDRSPASVDALAGLGRSRLEAGDAGGAVELFGRALAQAECLPRGNQALYHLWISAAAAYERAGQGEQAGALRARAWKLLPAANPGAEGFHV